MSDDYEKKMTDEMSKEEKRIYKTWSNKMRAEDDVRTLTEAKDIQDDPERKNMALACAKHKAKAMKKVADMGDE